MIHVTHVNGTWDGRCRHVVLHDNGKLTAWKRLLNLKYNKVFLGRVFQPSTTDRVIQSYKRFVTSTIRLSKSCQLPIPISIRMCLTSRYTVVSSETKLYIFRCLYSQGFCKNNLALTKDGTVYRNDLAQRSQDSIPMKKPACNLRFILEITFTSVANRNSRIVRMRS